MHYAALFSYFMKWTFSARWSQSFFFEKLPK